uniref:Uncharacterized protein n=1 Tax=Nelumbo nucifera TaxID=4432 RepID=A0A822YB95_NELNU|nr:TPA_asm: hypothetical protein HUJ06_031175 [Nelumbo nucifera]
MDCSSLPPQLAVPLALAREGGKALVVKMRRRKKQMIKVTMRTKSSMSSKGTMLGFLLSWSMTRMIRKQIPFGRALISGWTLGGRIKGKPVPDTLLEKARQEQEHVTSLDPKSRAAGGTETPWAQTPVTDLTAVGEGRGAVLSLKLDMFSDSVTGLTVVDPKGYLTDLKSMKITSDTEISDIKKARLLLKSVTQTNPNHPPGWIAAARLEEVAEKSGCSPGDAKVVIARGVKSIPNSLKLWMQVVKLEHDGVNKSRVLRKGLEHIPYSVRLWKAVVELANEEDAGFCFKGL